MAICEAWRKVGTAGRRRKLWSKLAYATRYGRVGLGEAARMDESYLSEYLDALGEIVSQENGGSAQSEK